ncbi:hypothetical protein ACUTVW_01190 [Paenibacillus sp. TSA_86.1]
MSMSHEMNTETSNEQSHEISNAVSEIKLSTRIKKTLKQKLADLVPAWEGRVQDIPASGEVLSGPCAVIAFAEEVPKSAWAGYRRIIKISPYARSEDGGAEQVEGWSALLIAGLHQVRLEDEQGGAFTCLYLGSTDSDRADIASGLVTRSLRFGVYVPEPERASENGVTSDPWLAALQQWTGNELGADWSLYADRWPGGYKMPSVLWRLSGYSTAVAGTSALEVRKQWIGHILTEDTSLTNQTVSHLVQRLSLQSRIPITQVGNEGDGVHATDASHTRYVTVDEVTADLQADAYLNGQIRLTLTQRIRRPVTSAPLMREIHHNKGIE